jgi:hypothetical protein
MFMRILKTLSLAALIGVFFVLFTQREVTFTPNERTLLKSQNPSLKIISVNEEAPPQNDTASPQTDVALSSSATSSVTTSNIAEVQQPIKKVEEISKKSVYITLQEGHSDTDESYRPTISPCKKPMGYKIGTFDTQFSITEDAFKAEIDKAQTLWGDQLGGKTLFKYSPTGELTINLIYDERQARTDDINNLALEIQNSKDTAAMLKETYDAEKIIYTGDGDQLTKDTDAFKVRYDAYISKVEMYNSKGGAPQDEYNRMTQELANLKEESKQLTARRDALLVYMESINTKVNRYNELVAYINTLITKSNSLGAKKFTEGRFTPRTNTIDIYQYTDLIKLRRVITHELGHVLGVNHNDNMKSIMYAVNSSTSTELSTEDIQTLLEVCPHN